ncbi:MAG: FAD-dependent oxidoreductase [Gammaproteobacteria bacterium]|jgi:3-phenylpropionate/trans-cinnamate dioxygenase ferredoxin reductase subunit|nr:FAD-dependent oxidoreductase [Gammaproteobacteria bacterium]MDP6617644.1 FAD-dependent oxidoreductase [Gammaproteobacteria bacterium]MDP6694521.1 FAD-dependent oxidoreductase [Gammaproteobacteria bacterium]MDP7041170.1 FAD-dependent oxidoreductase [Gammaproteobacteria bacterium]
MSGTIVIVGAGHAAGQASASLRQKGYTGRIVMVGEEAFVPYQRPPLSKKFLAGELKIEQLYFKPENFYPDKDIELRLSTRVTNIDRAARNVSLDNGETLEYEKLLLCTGGHVRKLETPGSNLAGIHYLRSIEDVLEIQKSFKAGTRLVIVGGGYVGLEVAAVAVERGLDVTLLESEDRVMSRVTGAEVSRFFQRRHREAGVRMEFGRLVEGFRGDGTIAEVVCADDSAIAADLCIVGVGILPNTDIAEDAGIECDDGILVDECCQTSDPDILAAGDCTKHPSSIFERTFRLESVHNAIEQGKTAAATICGERTPYNQAPWFWSDQYDIKLQIVGIHLGCDNLVVRGDPASNSFAAFYFIGNRLMAVDAINSPREFMLGKKLVTAKATFDLSELADESNDFKELATAALNTAG